MHACFQPGDLCDSYRVGRANVEIEAPLLSAHRRAECESTKNNYWRWKASFEEKVVGEDGEIVYALIANRVTYCSAIYCTRTVSMNEYSYSYINSHISVESSKPHDCSTI